MPTPRSPEVPKENLSEQTSEVVRERANIIDTTRAALEELARRLPRTEGRQERFVA